MARSSSLANGGEAPHRRNKQEKQLPEWSTPALPLSSKPFPPVSPGDPPHLLTGGSQTANTTPFGIVGSGIDTLVIGFDIKTYKVPESEFQKLEYIKQEAGKKLFGVKGKPITWFGKEFSVKPKGSKGYEWVLENGDLTMCMARVAQGGRIIPELYVTFHSVFLWGSGYKHAYALYRMAQVLGCRGGREGIPG